MSELAFLNIIFSFNFTSIIFLNAHVLINKVINKIILCFTSKRIVSKSSFYVVYSRKRLLYLIWLYIVFEDYLKKTIGRLGNWNWGF